MSTSGTIAMVCCKPKIRQLSLFPDILCSAYLVAESPKKAFYRIWIEANAGLFTVRKESGIWNTVLDKRAWYFDTLDKAQDLFDRRIKAKTNPQRKSPRKYTTVYNIRECGFDPGKRSARIEAGAPASDCRPPL